MAYHIEGTRQLTKIYKNGVQLEWLDDFELTVKMDGYAITYSQGASMKMEGGLSLDEVTGRLESSCYVVELGPTPRIMHKIDVSDQYGQAPYAGRADGSRPGSQVCTVQGRRRSAYSGIKDLVYVRRIIMPFYTAMEM